MLHTPFFSLQNAAYFIMLPFFGSCVIHILYTGCAKIKKKNSGAKGLMTAHVQFWGGLLARQFT